jgi:hypothetical protein
VRADPAGGPRDGNLLACGFGLHLSSFREAGGAGKSGGAVRRFTLTTNGVCSDGHD